MKQCYLLTLAAAFFSVSMASAQQTPRKPRIDDTIKGECLRGQLVQALHQR